MAPRILAIACIVAFFTAVVACVRWHHSSTPDLIKPGRRLHIVTIVTNAEHPNLRALVERAAFHGVTVTVVISTQAFGMGTGWGPRLRLMRRYLDTVPTEDVVMHVDGYDVLIDGTSEEILRRFDAIIHRRPLILFSAENACWPDEHVASRYPEIESPYKYLNGGTYMATAGVLRAMMDKHMDFASPSFDAVDDQREWTRAYLESNDIVLDSGNQIFNCMQARTLDLIRTPHGWFNTATNTYPLVFHGNGTTKKHLFDVTIHGLRSSLAR